MSFFETDDPELKKERAQELIVIAIAVVIGNAIAIPLTMAACWLIEHFL